MSSDDFFVPLSPIAPPQGGDISLDTSPEEEEVRASNFIYFNPSNRLYDTLELSNIFPQHMINRELGTPTGWDDEPIDVKVYVDDMNSVEKILQENAISQISHERRRLKIHAPKTEAFFEQVHDKARKIKMVVNQKKTQLLCISASVNDETSSYIRPTIDGLCSETCSSSSLKILGFSFNGRPTVNYHVDSMCKKFRLSLWSLRKLRRAGMKHYDLLGIYKTILRPIIEFACCTYGPMLNAALENDIERLQLRAFKIVFGVNVSYGTALANSETETLSERRNKLIEKFAHKTYQNPRYRNTWFPPAIQTPYITRNPKTLLEENSRTHRLYNSPIFHLRRVLNKSL